MPDIDINPRTPVTNGDLVSATNPLPCTSVAAAVVVSDIAANPSSFVTNGQTVSATNPLPISLS